jgi:hypothetical protein
MELRSASIARGYHRKIQGAFIRWESDKNFPASEEAGYNNQDRRKPGSDLL